MISKTSNLDLPESVAREMDEKATEKSGMSLFNWFTIASIATSLGLYVTGKKTLAIFIGLWPPTFQALKSATRRPNY